MKQGSLPELLAPAGSPDALVAAAAGGADAVYFGGALFSCRMRARNFEREELSEALALCRDAGVRSYLTLNIRMRDGEPEEALRFAAFLYENGADGLIVSDLGFAALVRQALPELELHASTQLSCVSPSDARTLASLGFSRMVCPRELSLPQIRELTAASPIGIEMFLHGAHCVSYSGQCLMSFALGGRSGNRGECAQPCRLPYALNGGAVGYPLSLKDMCLASHITDILPAGVSSLKIEGRQKSADYVYGVTRIYRRLLDERRNATPDEIASLSELFSRQGFTDGYLTGSYRRMGGIRGETKSAETPPLYTGQSARVPLHGVFTAAAGRPVTLSLTDGVRTGEAAGEVPLIADRAPLTAETVRESLTRFGGTVFTLAPEDLSVSLEGGLFLTRGQLNTLRRAALDALRGPARPAVSLPEIRPEEPAPLPPARARLVGEFVSRAQLSPEALAFFDEIRLPLRESRVGEVPVLPVILPGAAEAEAIRRLRELRPARAVAHTPGQIALLRALGIEPVASFRLTVMNAHAAAALRGLGCVAVELSPELSAAAVRALPGPKGFQVYGRLPLMLTARCVLSSGGEACTKGGTGGSCGLPGGRDTCRGVLRDRLGAEFPVLSDGCRSVIYNSVPIYSADRPALAETLGLTEAIYRFTTETREEAARAIAGDRPAAFRRIR